MRTRQTRIFISHSVHRDPDSRPKLDALVEKVRAHQPSVGILLDHSTLKLGEDWRSAINVWCGVCDAAILLVTRDSKEAEFCQYEWDILGYRRMLHPEFPILPIYVGTKPEDLRGRPHQLAELQGAMVDPADDASWARLPEWLDTIALPDNPTANQVKLIGSLVQKGVPKEDTFRLEQALAKINLEFGTWEPFVDSAQQFALQLTGVGLKKSVPALRHIRNGFCGKGEVWSNIRDLVAGSWVSDISALTLAALGACKPEERLFALNASEGSTARLYVIKASNLVPSDSWAIGYINDAVADLGELKLQVEISLKRALRLPPATNPEKLMELLKDKETYAREPVVLCISSRSLSPGWLTELRKTYPYITFFLLAGDDEFAIEPGRWIQPGVAAEFEAEFWTAYEGIKNALGEV